MAKKKNRKSQKNTASRLVSTNKTAKQSRYERQQKKYIDRKKANQKVKALPNKLTNRELEEYKKQLEPMVSEANRKIEMIEASGYVSLALDRVIHEGGTDYFSLDDVKTREELLQQITRMRVFLNDKGSTVDGAKLETAQIYAEEYRGKFGNQYNNFQNNYARYDIKSIDSQVAKRVFSNYRRIEEHRATEIVGDGAYGSENLIIAMYDAEIRGMDSLVYGEELLDAFVRTHNEEWSHVREDVDNIIAISGIIEDNLLRGGYF